MIFNNKLDNFNNSYIIIDRIMSTNSLLLSLYNNSKGSPTSRSSSMFIKNLTSIQADKS